jgi:hypothetical protein
MIGRRAIIGLSLLSALLICAFVAQSASAETARNTTAFTCVETGKGDFEDKHCDKTGPNKGKEKFAHVEIKLNETTEVDVEKIVNPVLKGTVPGGKTEIECTTVKNGKESTIHNTEPELGQHTFTGTVVTEFSGCTVKEPKKCIVAEPIVSRSTLHGVEKTGPEKNTMGVEFIGEGEEETFATIEYKNKEKEVCALNGQVFKVKGSAIATSGSGSQSSKESGATLVYEPGNEMQKLKLGANAAEFKGTFASKRVGGNYIALTTTT